VLLATSLPVVLTVPSTRFFRVACLKSTRFSRVACHKVLEACSAPSTHSLSSCGSLTPHRRALTSASLVLMLQTDGAAELCDDGRRCRVFFWRWVAVAAPLQRCFPSYETFAFHVVARCSAWMKRGAEFCLWLLSRTVEHNASRKRQQLSNLCSTQHAPELLLLMLPCCGGGCVELPRSGS
jgi:hypothetical protein